MALVVERPASRDALTNLVTFHDEVYRARGAFWGAFVPFQLPVLTGESPLAEDRRFHPLVVRDGGRTLARVVAVIDERYRRHWRETIGHLVMFEALPGTREAVRLLMDAACEWLAANGATAARAGSGVLEFPFVGGLPVPGQDVPLAVLLDGHVADVRADRAGQVGRQRPRRGGPGQQPLPGLQLEPDGHRRVLPLGVGVVVHPQLVVGQRGLAAPAVRQHLEALVDQALVPQLPEGPHDALHVGEVERLVVILEVDPARLPGHVVLPLVRVAQHGLAAGLVELLDAHRDDVGLAGDAKQAFGLHLGGQPVAVPAEPALHALSLHGTEPWDQVFDVAGDQVPVVGEPVGERRPVVEHELVVGRALPDRLAERVAGLPVVQHLALERGEVRLGGNVVVPGTRVTGRSAGAGWSGR